ncbi:hypothetical protein HYW75_06005 [Candidatus Pacearchaeota archaeon]|nr:hypothetical protein [Candidatus Pacearchaeota archaeon]
MPKQVEFSSDPISSTKLPATPSPFEIRIVLNLEHEADHPDYLANSKELECLISGFPIVMQSQVLKLFLTGSRSVTTNYGNYRLTNDISQFISYEVFRNISRNEKSPTQEKNIPVRILTYECIDNWALVVKQTQERIAKSQEISEQASKYPGPKIPGPSVYS